MFGRHATGLVVILTFGRRTAPLAGPAKVIDGDTIVVAEQLVRLHGVPPNSTRRSLAGPADSVRDDVLRPPSRRS
jgi:hypothetical protein